MMIELTTTTYSSPISSINDNFINEIAASCAASTTSTTEN